MTDSPDSKDLNSLLLRTDRPERLRLIEDWYEHGVISERLLRTLLGEWLTDSEFQGDRSTKALARLFRATGFVTDTEGTELPTTPLTIYRGASPRRA